MSNEKPEALRLAEWCEENSPSIYRQSAETAKELRRLHARVQELEKDLGNAKRLTSKIWDKHPEARETIEEGTGAWLVFGQDVETGGVSAHRVTQAAQAREATAEKAMTDLSEHYCKACGRIGEIEELSAEDKEKLHKLNGKPPAAAQNQQKPEPFGYFKAEPFGWRDCAETDEGAIALYEAPQPQADALDTERLDWLIEQGCSHGVVYEGLDKSFWMVWLDEHDALKDKHQISRYHTAREAIDAAKGFPAAKENK